MGATPPSATTVAQAHSSPDGDRAGAVSTNGSGDAANPNSNGPNQTVGAAAAAQQPKVVQTAFIHKLYKYAPFLVQQVWRVWSQCADNPSQYARGPQHPTSHFVVKFQR